MSVVIAYEETGPCRKVLTIEVPAPAVDAEVGRVIRELGQRVRIDGFRRGKIPRSMLRKRFKVEIEDAVAERLVPRYWRQAEAEKSLDPVLPPEISDLKLEEGAPMTFVAEVDVRPEITLDLEQPFDLPDPSVEPAEADLEETFDDLRRHHATWHTVERSAAVGDQVAGTMQLLAVDGEPQMNPETEQPEPPGPIEIEVGAENVWEEVSLAATGLSAGQGGELERKTPGDEPKTLRYRLQVGEVRERELPELDDALAAKIGDFASVDALRDAVAERIRAGKQEDRRRTRRERLFEQLRDRHKVDLPERLVEQERERMLHAMMHRMAEQGVDVEKAEIDWRALGEQARPEAEKAVHERLVLDAVADAQDVRVDEQAFEQLIAALAAKQKTSRLELRQELAESGRLALMRAQMRRDRTVARLTGEEAEAEAARKEAEAAAIEAEAAIAAAADTATSTDVETSEEE